VRTRVELGARRGRGGGSVLEVLAGHGQLAARETGPGTVHLVATAAGPLGGDRVEVAIRVYAGASLSVRSAAASVALPGPSDAVAVVDLVATVEDGGELEVSLEPSVVVARAVLWSSATFHLAGTARVRHREQVVVGRWGEPAGTWRGTFHADRDGVPLLRHAICLGPGSPDWVAPHDYRALLAEHWLGGPTPEYAATRGDAVAMPLAGGGLLVTAVASELAAARRDAGRALAAADPTAAPAQPMS
jgi:urease accessory protein